MSTERHSPSLSRPAIFTCMVALLLFNLPALAQSTALLTRHLPEAVLNGQAKPLGRLPATQIMQLDLTLPLRDQTELDSFLGELYDPASPIYRKFLTVDEFTARFGPSQQDYDAAVEFARAHGFDIVGGTRESREVQIKGPVSAVEEAFHIHMLTYRHPTEDRIFFAPDREPATDLPFPLWHIAGLDNYSIPRPLYVTRGEYAQAHGIVPEEVTPDATTGSGPSSSFLASDMRAAYYGGSSLTGAGQNLGLFEFYGTNLTDLNTYFTNVSQTNSVPITLLSVDTSPTYCDNEEPLCDREQTLDLTQAIGMAPGLAKITMYIGATDTAILGKMATNNPLPATISCSWSWSGADPNTLNPWFMQFAAQGQSFFAASGDHSTWSTSNVAWPADSQYVTSVGGTDLETYAGGPWLGEFAWADSGGGISPDGIAIPAWQQLAGVIDSSNHGSTTYRNGPDVAANANTTFYSCGDLAACITDSGGTSYAAPMWAAYIALVNQQAVANGLPRVGFLNPTIYAQNVASNYYNYAWTFHDIASGTSGSYSAVPGYDLVTGWGSPSVPGLIRALGPPTFGVKASPASNSIDPGDSTTVTVSTAAFAGFNAPITLFADGPPTQITFSFSPSTIAAPGAGTSTLTISASSSAPPGSYGVWINASSGKIINLAYVVITINAPCKKNCT